jgi:hypothetical protein
MTIKYVKTRETIDIKQLKIHTTYRIRFTLNIKVRKIKGSKPKCQSAAESYRKENVFTRTVLDIFILVRVTTGAESAGKLQFVRYETGWYRTI